MSAIPAEQVSPQPLPLAVTLTTDKVSISKLDAAILARIARRMDDRELLTERELQAVKALEAQVGGLK